MAEVKGSCHVSNEALVQLAIEARNHAYVPYSHYAVGAALLCSDGTVYGGANLENAAYTPSNCAERTAFFRAVSSRVSAPGYLAYGIWSRGSG